MRTQRYTQACDIHLVCGVSGEVLTAVNTQHGALLVCLKGDIFVGFGSFHMVQDESLNETADATHYALISDVCTLEQFRGIGAAKAVFDGLFDVLKKRGYKGRVRVCALVANTLATGFYEKYGFTPYEVTYERQMP